MFRGITDRRKRYLSAFGRMEELFSRVEGAVRAGAAERTRTIYTRSGVGALRQEARGLSDLLTRFPAFDSFALSGTSESVVG